MKVKVILGTATIALVGFVGAVCVVLGQEMPDIPQASVTPVVEAEIEPDTAETIDTIDTIDTVDASPLVEQAPVAITAPKEVVEETDTAPTDIQELVPYIIRRDYMDDEQYECFVSYMEKKYANRFELLVVKLRASPVISMARELSSRDVCSMPDVIPTPL